VIQITINVLTASVKLIHGYYKEGYDPTMEDSSRKYCVVDDEPALLDVSETQGEEEYTAMREQYMRSGEGFLLVYNITFRDTFDDIAALQQQILRVKNKDSFPMVLVGNYCSRESEREVSVQEAQDLARQFGCKYIETCPEKGINVNEAFHDLVRAIRKYNGRWFGWSPMPRQDLIDNVSKLKKR